MEPKMLDPDGRVELRVPNHCNFIGHLIGKRPTYRHRRRVATFIDAYPASGIKSFKMEEPDVPNPCFKKSE